MTPSGMVTLLTDFGLEDPYVAMMKGVILSINPGARLIDITHQIPPGTILQAAQVLEQTFSCFPEGTVHLTVVDPGVGTGRRAIAAAARSHLFVGPDNGLFWPILEASEGTTVVHLTETRWFLPHISPTFHGRDIFAPVAGHLSKGMDLLRLGPPIHDPIRLAIPKPHREGDRLLGQVVRVDRFGNLITNIGRQEMLAFLGGRRPSVHIGDVRIDGIEETYGQAEQGRPLALFDSSGRLEIAVCSGRAADLIGPAATCLVGVPVRVSRNPSGTDHS